MRRRDSLPVVDPADLPSEESRPSESVHGVVLAAGTSSRFGGRNKLLEPVDGTPLVRRAVRTAAASDLDGVTVVVGHDADRVRAALDGLDVRIRRNDRFADGQSTSVAVGVAAARERNADAVLVALGDMPAVSVGTVNLLLSAYSRGEWTALAAACDGRRGNPVLFDGRHFDALRSVEGDAGGREVLLAEGVLVETGDPGVLRDVDRPEDL